MTIQDTNKNSDEVLRIALPSDGELYDSTMAFMRAYRMARELAITGSPEEIARLEAEFFPEIHIEALANTVRFYQQLGCWSPHLEITQQAFEVAVDVFLHSKAISQRPSYDLAVYPVPTI